MSNELNTRSTTGSSVYAVIRNSALQLWQVTTSSFVTESDGDYSTYAVTLTEQGETGFFTADFPSGINTAGTYIIEFFQGSGVEGDPFVAGGMFQWSGTDVIYDNTGTALTSLEYVKDAGGITNSTSDSYLMNRINAASTAITSWCGRDFVLESYTESLDGPDSTTLRLRHTPVSSVASVVLNQFGGQPVTISGSDIIVNSYTGLISVKPTSNGPYWFPADPISGQQSISVTYNAGFATIPLDVQEACAQVVLNQYYNRGSNLTMQSEKLLDYQYTRRSDAMQLIPVPVQAALFHYKVIAV